MADPGEKSFRVLKYHTSLENRNERFGRISCLRDGWRWRQQFHPYLLYPTTSCALLYARRQYCPLLKRMQRNFVTLLGVFLITRLKSNFYTVLNTLDTTKHNSVISRAQNATPFQPNVFLIGTHGILVTNKGDSAFCSSNHCQGQLLTPKSVPAMFIEHNVVRNISEMATRMDLESSCGVWFDYYVTICLKRLKNHKKLSLG